MGLSREAAATLINEEHERQLKGEHMNQLTTNPGLASQATKSFLSEREATVRTANMDQAPISQFIANSSLMNQLVVEQGWSAPRAIAFFSDLANVNVVLGVDQREAQDRGASAGLMLQHLNASIA